MGIQMIPAEISIYDRTAGWQTLDKAYPSMIDPKKAVIVYFDPKQPSGTIAIRQGNTTLSIPILQWKWTREKDTVVDQMIARAGLAA